jgi:hypothetical protein
MTEDDCIAAWRYYRKIAEAFTHTARAIISIPRGRRLRSSPK